MLLLAGCQAAPRGVHPIREVDFKPIVLVFARFPGSLQIGNGFAVGDGTLIVTARHLVFEKPRGGGAHRMEGLVTVVSPWFGDGCEAELVFEDSETDLAVLRVPWEGHPAYALAGDDAVRRAKRVWIAGLDNVEYMQGAVAEPPAALGDTRILELARMARGRGGRVSAHRSKGMGLWKGWSGSPILLPATGAAIGCFTKASGRGERVPENITGVSGPTLAAVRDIVSNARPCDRVRPEHARAAFLLYLDVVRHASGFKDDLELRDAREFIRLRPESPFGYRMAGKAARKLGQPDLSQEFFEKAFSLDPDNPVTRILRARSLQNAGRDNDALRELDALLASGRGDSLAALYLWRHHADRRGDYARGASVLDEALRHEPDNARLWSGLASCQKKLGNKEAAAVSRARATTLMPHISLTRRMRR